MKVASALEGLIVCVFEQTQYPTTWHRNTETAYVYDIVCNKPSLTIGLLNPFNAEATFAKHKDAKIFENRLNPAFLVFIR